MKLQFIEYANTQLVIPVMLVKYFPVDIDYKNLPTFCGPGGGIGDKAVPDTVKGVWVAVCCLIHDWCFSVGSRSVTNFIFANLIFLWNLVSLVMANGDLGGWFSKMQAVFRCTLYWFGVLSVIGWKCFNPEDVKDPMESKDFVEKLNRLKLVKA